MAEAVWEHLVLICAAESKLLKDQNLTTIFNEPKRLCSDVTK